MEVPQRVGRRKQRRKIGVGKRCHEVCAFGMILLVNKAAVGVSFDAEGGNVSCEFGASGEAADGAKEVDNGHRDGGVEAQLWRLERFAEGELAALGRGCGSGGHACK